MLAPMTRIAAHNPNAWYRVERTASSRSSEAAPRQPDGRISVHQIHGVGDGRRHGGRARDGHARARRRARDPGRPPRVSARAGRTRAIRCSSPNTRISPRSPAMQAASAEALRIAGSTVDDINVLRPLLVLRELVALRVRRPGDQERRSPRPHGHGWAPVSRRSGERLSHALDRGDGRAPARRTRRDRPGQRRRHAHDEARLRCLRGGAGPRRATRCRPPCRPRPTVGDRPRWSPSTKAKPRWVRIPSCTVATVLPNGRLLVCDLDDGRRTYAQARDIDLCREAERSELVGQKVMLEPQTVEGSAGRVRVNRATW